MKLYVFILMLGVLVSSEVNVMHSDFQFSGCSDTEKEFLYGFDGEEMFHSDFIRKKLEATLPDFGDPVVFSQGYELSLREQEICKGNMAKCIKAYKNPPEEMDEPETSIYAENDVQQGVENILVCHVTGFFPPPISVLWTKNNLKLKEDMGLSQYRRNSDGTFNIFSSLTIIPEEGDIYSCTVNHKAFEKPQTKTWEVDVAMPSVGPAVFCGLGLALGLLGVATGTFFLIKGNNCN